MDVKYAIGDIYRVIGTLEGLTMMQGQTLNEAMVTVLAECVDKLELIGSQLIYRDVNANEGRTKVVQANIALEGTPDQ